MLPFQPVAIIPPHVKVNRDKIELKIWVKQREWSHIENIYFFIIYFTVQSSPCKNDNESTNWNWYCNLFDFDSAPTLKEGQKILVNFLQFSKHKTANERGCFTSIERELNKFMFVFSTFYGKHLPSKMSRHRQRIAPLSPPDSIIIEINYSAPRFVRFCLVCCFFGWGCTGNLQPDFIHLWTL